MANIIRWVCAINVLTALGFLHLAYEYDTIGYGLMPEAAAFAVAFLTIAQLCLMDIRNNLLDL